MSAAQQAVSPWQPIDTAPLDRELYLRGWYEPSAHAASNGARCCWVYGVGRPVYARSDGKGYHWSGILGGSPTHWQEKEQAA